MERIEQCGYQERRIESFDPAELLHVIRDGRFDHRLLESGKVDVRHDALFSTGPRWIAETIRPATTTNRERRQESS